MRAKPGIYINFLPEEKHVSVSQKDQSVLDVALRSGVELNHTCGGHGTCGTCLVEVLAGLENLDPRTEVEAEMAEDRGFRPGERLACQTRPASDLTVMIKSNLKG